jgi:hypothetical protein
MTSFVLDSSTTLSWLMPNETASLDLLKKTVKEGAIVPTIWLLEIGNVLLDFFRNSLMLRDLKETRNAEPQRTLMYVRIRVPHRRTNHQQK